MNVRANRKASAIVLTTSALVFVSLLFVLDLPANPGFEGKRVSTWFAQLGSADRNSNNVPVCYIAEGAFERMPPEAAPYLAIS